MTVSPWTSAGNFILFIADTQWRVIFFIHLLNAASLVSIFPIHTLDCVCPMDRYN